MAASEPGSRALVFSGGALRCVCQLGVAEAFRGRGLGFDYFAGTSGGALTGALLAAGLTPREALGVFKARSRGALFGARKPRWGIFSSWFSSWPAWLGGWGKGLLDASVVRAELAAYLPGDSFDALPGSLAVAAIHLRTGTPVLFAGARWPQTAGMRLCRRQPLTAAVGAPVSMVVAVNVGLEGKGARLPVEGWGLMEIFQKAADIVVQDQASRALAGWRGTAMVISLAPEADAGLFDPSPDALERSFAAGREIGDKHFVEENG